MRHYRVIYQKIDKREVWIETNAENEQEAEEVFMRNFEQYDDESDSFDGFGGDMDVLSVDEIDENGEDI
jgi:hypothetical protein